MQLAQYLSRRDWENPTVTSIHRLAAHTPQSSLARSGIARQDAASSSK